MLNQSQFLIPDIFRGGHKVRVDVHDIINCVALFMTRETVEIQFLRKEKFRSQLRGVSKH